MRTSVIEVISCHRDVDLGYNQAIRDTWGSQCVALGYDVRFFVGNGSSPLLPDEVQVNAPDDYNSVPLKIREMCRWAIDHNYDEVFQCDTDTYIVADKFHIRHRYQSGYDYVGCMGDVDFPRKLYAYGGYGYWLSRRACLWITEAAVNQDDPSETCGDAYVARVMTSHLPQLSWEQDRNYGQHCTFHLKKVRYDPQMMYDLHRSVCLVRR